MAVPHFAEVGAVPALPGVPAVLVAPPRPIVLAPPLLDPARETPPPLAGLPADAGESAELPPHAGANAAKSTPQATKTRTVRQVIVRKCSMHID